MILDPRPRGGRQVHAERGQPAIEAFVEGRGQLRQALDARRERFSRAGQAALLWICPSRPRATPGVVVCAPWDGSSVFRSPFGSRPGLPVPLASLVTLLPRPWCGGRTLPKGGRVCQCGYPPIHVSVSGTWTTRP